MKIHKIICIFCTYLLFAIMPSYANAEITVKGLTSSFVDLINSLLKGATVNVDAKGNMTINGDPTNEFGKQLKQVIDSVHKITLDAVKDKDGITTGSFDGGGNQTIDISDVENFKGPNSDGLPTKGAQVIHEIKEPYDAVKDGKPNDYKAAHEGSAKEAEDAVNKEEADITRKDEGTPLPERNGSYKIKEKYNTKKGTAEVETIVKRDGNNHKIESVGLETASAPRSGRFVVEEEPGVRLFNESMASTGFVPLDHPGYMEIDSFGKIYVSEQDQNKVVVFNAAMDLSGALSLMKSGEMTYSTMQNPQGIAVTTLQNRVFVGSGDEIIVFDSQGNFLSTFTNPFLKSVKGLEVDRDGNLYASSFGNDLVLVFDPLTGNVLNRISSPLLDGPEGIAIDQLGNIWVSSFMNDSILHFNPNGTFDSLLSSGGALDGPMGLGLTPQGFLVPGLLPGAIGNLPETLLVSSYNNNSLLEYDLETGNLLNSTYVKTPVGVEQLTAEPVPEPGTFMLISFGSLAFLAYKKRWKRSKLGMYSVF